MVYPSKQTRPDISGLAKKSLSWCASFYEHLFFPFILYWLYIYIYCYINIYIYICLKYKFQYIYIYIYISILKICKYIDEDPEPVLCFEYPEHVLCISNTCGDALCKQTKHSCDLLRKRSAHPIGCSKTRDHVPGVRTKEHVQGIRISTEK